MLLLQTVKEGRKERKNKTSKGQESFFWGGGSKEVVKCEECLLGHEKRLFVSLVILFPTLLAKSVWQG